MRPELVGAACALGLLLSSFPVAAQVPLTLSEETGAPYQVLDFNNSRTTMRLDGHDYYLVYDNQGDTPAEYWVSHDSRTVAHATFGGNAGVRLEIDQPGDYAFTFNGQGQFAVVRPELVDDLGLPRASLNLTSAGRLAFAVGRDAPTFLACVESAQPIAVKFTDSAFHEVASRSGVTAANHTFPGGMFALAFVEGTGHVEAIATTAPSCHPPKPASQNQAPAVSSLALLAGMVFAAICARSVTSRKP